MKDLKKGIIISIQGFTLATTQELAQKAISGGAVAIRTDQPIKINVPVIGLKKNNKEYYITTDKNDLAEVLKWADIVAIDSRKGNIEIQQLYFIAKLAGVPIMADIESESDAINILQYNPDFISTTFSFMSDHANGLPIPDLNLISQIKKMDKNARIIAEGGIFHGTQISKAIKNGADNICIGRAVSKIDELTNDFVKYYDKGLSIEKDY